MPTFYNARAIQINVHLFIIRTIESSLLILSIIPDNGTIKKLDREAFPQKICSTIDAVKNSETSIYEKTESDGRNVPAVLSVSSIDDDMEAAVIG